MSLELYWDDELTGVLRWDFVGEWTWQEYHDAVQQSRVLMLESDHERVDIVIDLRQSRRLLPGIIQHVLHDERTNTPQHDAIWHKSVVIGGGLLVKAILETLVRSSETIRKHCAVAKTVADARQVILADRQRSPMLQS